LGLWDSDPSPGVFNLSQLWMIGHLAAGGVQTVESGWIVYPGLRGLGTAPGLFVFFNPDNYGPRSGYLVNQAGEGFIQVSSSWTLFSGLTHISRRGGDQYGLQMLWQLKGDGNNAGWWLWIGQDAASFDKVGFFPAYLYQGGPLTQATHEVQFGGEVASRVGDTRTGPMGSGVAPYQDPEDSWLEVAFQNEMYVQTQPGADMDQASLQLVSTSTEPCFSPNYQGALYDSDKWKSYFFFGGPGAL
jgi:hypothetical protein